jgi:hypothetical protein
MGRNKREPSQTAVQKAERAVSDARWAVLDYQRDVIYAYLTLAGYLEEMEAMGLDFRFREQMGTILGDLLIGRYTSREIQHLFDELSFGCPVSNRVWDALQRFQTAMLEYVELEQKRHLAVSFQSGK